MERKTTAGTGKQIPIGREGGRKIIAETVMEFH